MVHLTTALDAESGVPLYEQLYRSLAAEMRTGAISAGTRMPGKRRLAAELSVSVNTVDAAYQMLAAEDYVEAGGISGTVMEVGLAYTKLCTVDNKVISVPNGQISGEKIINYSTEERRRVDLTFNASYDSPLQQVTGVLRAVVAAHPMQSCVHFGIIKKV